MKSKDLQKVVLSKYKNGDSPPMMFRHLNGAVDLRTIGRRCKMIRETGSIDLSSPIGRPRVVRTEKMIEKSEKPVKTQKPSIISKISKRIGHF
jgi:hypothetical protein